MSGSGPHKIPVVFYRTHGGAEVVRDWLRSLDDADRRAVGLDLMRVHYRWPVGMPLCRALGVGGAHVAAEQSDRPRPVQLAARLHSSAHFPKFVLHLRTHLSRTSESYGH